MRLRLWPFAWGLGVCAGAMLAVAFGAYGPTWGVAAAFPAVSALFAIGAYFERDGEEITQLLRLTVGFTIGFLLATIPINLLHLLLVVRRADPSLTPAIAERAAELRLELWPRWGVIALAAPIGAATLFWRILRGAKKPTNGSTP